MQILPLSLPLNLTLTLNLILTLMLIQGTKKLNEMKKKMQEEVSHEGKGIGMRGRG